jgi:flagellar L-ring protein precursor FlgH
MALAGSPAGAQSLFERSSNASSSQDSGADQRASRVPVAQDLQNVSLFAIQPPEPRTFQQNDLVTIIVSERTRYDRSVETESEKKLDMGIDIDQFVDLLELFEFRVVDEDGVPVGIDLGANNKFEGEGTFEQEDRMTDRITARVLDVKPNGTLVLEAKRSLSTDGSEFVLTLSGVCRSEDITDANTVQSNELFDMRLDVQNSGELRRTTEKGVITRLLETLFYF